MRLSSVTGDYTGTGTIIDRQLITALGGETVFKLSFIDGSEEVYKDGKRLNKGASKDYTVSAGLITLVIPLTTGQELLLVGRDSTNEIPFTKSASESVILIDGQTEVIFTSIETEALELYISGPLVDRGRLASPVDYEVINSTTISLIHTYPEGSILEGVQGLRFAWLNANDLIVNDGEKSKSISSRFSDTQESIPYFIETNGLQLQTLTVGMELRRWSVDSVTGVPIADLAGDFPILKVGKSYWTYTGTTSSLAYSVVNWTVYGNMMSITVVDVESGESTVIPYSRNIGTSGGSSSSSSSSFSVFSIDSEGYLISTTIGDDTSTEYSIDVNGDLIMTIV